MNILITGSAGFLGKNLARTLGKRHTIIGADRSESPWTNAVVELTDKTKVRDLIHAARPSVIIHGAALANTDYVETHRQEARAINVGGTNNLLESMEGNDTRFIFISSDYVYDGVKGNFNEESALHPINYYGQTKVEGEQLVEKHKNHLILRPAVLFGWDPGGKNFFMQMMENQRAKRPMRVPMDQQSNPTYIELLADVIQRGISKELTGTFVATGPETMSRYEFAMQICNIFGFAKELITPIQTSELGQTAKRPLNCGTNSSRLCQALSLNFPSVRQSLKKLKQIVSSPETLDYF